MDGDTVVERWRREGLSKEEARRRLSEVLLVATTDAGKLVVVSSAYVLIYEVHPGCARPTAPVGRRL